MKRPLPRTHQLTMPDPGAVTQDTIPFSKSRPALIPKRISLLLFSCLILCLPYQTLAFVSLPQPSISTPSRISASHIFLYQAKEDSSSSPSAASARPRSKAPPKRAPSRRAPPSKFRPQNNGAYKKYNNNNNNNSIDKNKGFPNSKKLNQQLVQCESAKEVLQVVASQKGALTSLAGGGALNSVNFSTAIHRIARHVSFQNYNKQKQHQNNNNNQQNHDDPRYKRALVLSDPRFALLLCSMAEGLGGVSIEDNNDNNKQNQKRSVFFGSREMSNIAWALAKMKIAPPEDAAPLILSNNNNNSKPLLLDMAQKVREDVMQVAKARQQGDQEANSQAWVPNLSLLCGHILDTIAQRSMDESSTFAFQERSNLLWALATADRANDVVFNTVMTRMVDDMRKVQAKHQESNKSGSNNNNLQQQQQGNQFNNDNRQRRNDSLLNPQEWSNSIWAFATTRIFGNGQERLLQYTAELLQTQQEFGDMFKPQEWSNTAWGVATLLSNKKKKVTDEERDAALIILRHVAKAVSTRAEEFKTQELSNSAWAFATLGFGASLFAYAEQRESSLNDYVTLESDDPEGDKELLDSAMDAILKSAQPRLHRFRSQELNNLAWSMARLDFRQETDVLEAIGLQLCDRRRHVTSQDISTTVWSLATLEYSNDDIYRSIASRLSADHARNCKPQELSNTLWAMATVEVIPHYLDIYDSVIIRKEEQFKGPLEAIDDPVTQCFGIAARELMRRPFDFKTQEIKDILWSFSKVGMRYPELFKNIAEHLVGNPDRQNAKGRTRIRGLDDFSPQGLGNMAWAFARQAQLATDVTSRVENVATHIVLNSGRMAVYATSYFDIGEMLIQRLFASIAEADLRVHGNLSKLKPQDLSNTAWAMAVLGMRHTAFLEAAEKQLLARTRQFINQKKFSAPRFKGQELANLLWAFATLDYSIKDTENLVGEFMIQVTQAENMKAAGIARVFNRQELANVAWSYAVFGLYPAAVMTMLYSGLVGIGDERDPKYLRSCFGDPGLQNESVMALIYVQLAMEREGLQNGLSLPENFPDAWSQRSASDRIAADLETPFELSVSTSKIQRAVGAAFHRIGFEHIEEHVISMQELLDNQGVPLSQQPREVLSIDLANLEEKVAIEVDGPSHFVTSIDAPPTNDVGFAKRSANGRLEYQFSMNGDRLLMNGPTLLKERLLQRVGWFTINIPFWEWYSLDGDEDLEDAYCLDLLKKLN